MSRAYTQEEMLDKIFHKIKGIRDYWLNESRCPTVEEKVDGVIFTILSTLDGSSMDLPAFDLVPAPHDSDKEYHEERGENYWDRDERISVMLHELWGAWNRKNDG